MAYRWLAVAGFRRTVCLLWCGFGPQRTAHDELLCFDDLERAGRRVEDGHVVLEEAVGAAIAFGARGVVEAGVGGGVEEELVARRMGCRGALRRALLGGDLLVGAERDAGGQA